MTESNNLEDNLDMVNYIMLHRIYDMLTLIAKGSVGKEDVEKMVLPAIVYINTNHKSFKETRRKGFMICFGWWDWSIKIGAIMISMGFSQWRQAQAKL